MRFQKNFHTHLNQSYPKFQPANLIHINAKIMLRIYKHMPCKIPSSAFSQRSTQKQTDNCHYKRLNYRIAIDPLISIPQNTFIFLAYASFCKTIAHACICNKVARYSKKIYQKFSMKSPNYGTAVMQANTTVLPAQFRVKLRRQHLAISSQYLLQLGVLSTLSFFHVSGQSYCSTDGIQISCHYKYLNVLILLHSRPVFTQYRVLFAFSSPIQPNVPRVFVPLRQQSFH